MRVKPIDIYKRVKEAHTYDENSNLIPPKYPIVFNRKPFFLFHYPKGKPRKYKPLNVWSVIFLMRSRPSVVDRCIPR